MGRAKQRLVTATPQGSLKADIKQAAAPAVVSEQATSAPPVSTPDWAAIGADVEVHRNYLDMKDAPDENGLPHCGYLVLRKGEVVRIYYVGCVQTGDAGWIYGEVLKTIAPELVGRRGWLPVTHVAPKTVQSPAGSAAAAPPARNNARASTGRPPTVAPPEPQPPAQQPKASVPSPASKAPAAAQARRVPAAKVGGATGATDSGAGPSRGTQSRAAPAAPAARLNEQMFPSLGPEQARSGQAAPRVWGLTVPEPPPEPEPGPQDRKVVAATIKRHRQLASKAAAEAKKNPDKKGTKCPICMETYDKRRFQTNRPCCNVELCAQCDHKSLRSGKCYFCREEAGDFPDLGVACRVAD